MHGMNETKRKPIFIRCFVLFLFFCLSPNRWKGVMRNINKVTRVFQKETELRKAIRGRVCTCVRACARSGLTTATHGINTGPCGPNIPQ